MLRKQRLYVHWKRRLVGLVAILETANLIRRVPALKGARGRGLWAGSPFNKRLLLAGESPAMAIVNATPHSLILLVEDEAGDIAGTVGFGRGRAAQFRQVVELAPSGLVPRAATTKVALSPVEVDGVRIPVDRTAYGEVENLPEPDGETTYVVSLLTARAAAVGGRTTDDLLVVGEAVRDTDGKIIGCTGFGRI